MLIGNQKHNLYPRVVKDHLTPHVDGWMKWNTDASRIEVRKSIV